ncbi:MAG: hypothetical protein IT384_19655 [Deltaproteobacteria bacterium]|nr:hypothetical protein [Deltaproteobacteria bacterium]
MRRKLHAILFAALPGATLGLSTGCEEDVIRRLPEPEIQIDELKQRPAALVDILWVVDNSGSMVEEQAALAQNFQRFISGLTVCQGAGGAQDLCDFNTKKCAVSGAPCNPPDYHIGVISTDVRDSSTLDQGRLRRVGLCVPSAGASPSNNKQRYCWNDPRHCGADPQDPAADPANTFCDMNQSINFVTPTTAGAASAFGRMVRVGTGGAAAERGIEAAARALGRHTNRQTGQFVPAPTENAGFLRPEASLFVIFVSDEDDDANRGGSFGQTSYFYRAFESLKGAGNEGLVSLSAIVGDPDVDGEQGAGTGGCPAPPSDPTAFAGNSYIRLAMYSRGLTSEFRVCDDQRLVCPTGNACQRPVPGFPGICVPSGACQRSQDCGNFKCGDEGCVSCDNGQCVAKATGFLDLLQRNGIFGSICAPDYGVVLGALGFEAAGLRRKFELTRFPDCAKRVPCNGAEASVCVKVGDQFIANERATGWVYEPGSNAVFFDGSFVPPTDATIEVSYRISAANKALSCEAVSQ